MILVFGSLNIDLGARDPGSWPNGTHAILCHAFVGALNSLQLMDEPHLAMQIFITSLLLAGVAGWAMRSST
jgi:hypothetical protein